MEERRWPAEKKKRDNEAKAPKKEKNKSIGTSLWSKEVGPDLIYGSKPSSSITPSSINTTGGSSLTKHKKRNNPVITSAC